MKAIFFLLISILISACSSLPKTNSLSPASSVDLKRYMGDWYVIANIPTFLEQEAVNAVESYRWDESKKEIYIDSHHRHGRPTGYITSYLQTAWLGNSQSNAEWKIRPMWPLELDYMILDVAPDYSYSLVGLPDRSYVWIMSRDPHMPEATYTKLVSRAEEMGFDTTKLRKVPQVW